MTTTSAQRSRLEQTIVDRVGDRAAEWFPGITPGEVRLQLLASRPRSLTYAVRVGPATTPQVLAKVRRGSLAREGPDGAGSGRPRLVPNLLGARDLTAWEHQGLVDLDRVFSGSADGVRTVRPLDHLADEHAILMEYVDGRTLRELLGRQSRLSRWTGSARRPPEPDVWERTGRWLRVFHDALPTEGLAARQATRADVVDRFEAYQGFLGERLPRRTFPDLGTAGAQLALDVLPSRLPMAVGHGDFAPRNVLVVEDGRIAVFDPMPRWAVPRHEDLARFLVGLRLVGPQLVSGGTAFDGTALDRRASEVVRGYADDRGLPSAQVHCYELLVLLDTWAELVSRSGAGPGGHAHAALARVAGRHLRRQAELLLRLAGTSG